MVIDEISFFADKGKNFDDSWNPIWTSEAVIDDEGWCGLDIKNFKRVLPHLHNALKKRSVKHYGVKFGTAYAGEAA